MANRLRVKDYAKLGLRGSAIPQPVVRQRLAADPCGAWPPASTGGRGIGDLGLTTLGLHRISRSGGPKRCPDQEGITTTQGHSLGPGPQLEAAGLTDAPSFSGVNSFPPGHLGSP